MRRDQPRLLSGSAAHIDLSPRLVAVSGCAAVWEGGDLKPS